MRLFLCNKIFRIDRLFIVIKIDKTLHIRLIDIFICGARGGEVLRQIETIARLGGCVIKVS